MKTNGLRVEDLAARGLTVQERYVIPLWLGALGAMGKGTGRLLVRLACWLVRAWTVTAPTALAVATHVYLGRWATVGLVVGYGIGLLVWWRVHPSSFAALFLARVRGWWRWKTHYRRLWYPVMDGTDLLRVTKTHQIYVPKVSRVRSTAIVDRIELRLLHGQTPAEFAMVAEGLRHAFAAYRCKVTELAPGKIRISLYTRDPLVNLVPIIDPAAVPDVEALHVALAEDGQAYFLRLLGTHVLVVGATGTGKGSVLGSTFRALAPAIHAGTVVLTGLDPKGGMELYPSRALFTHYADEDLDTLVAELEDAVHRLVIRKARLKAAGLRMFVPSVTDPFEVIVIDELAVLTAYAPSKALKERVKTALSTLLTQGRAVGFCVIAALQDPRKEILPFRDLFPTRIALRLAESSHVEMVLGEGALDRGAACHLIPDTLPGVGYAWTAEACEPVRVRFPFIDDPTLADMARDYAAPVNTPGDLHAGAVQDTPPLVIDLRDGVVPAPRGPRDGDQ